MSLVIGANRTRAITCFIPAAANPPQPSTLWWKRYATEAEIAEPSPYFGWLPSMTGSTGINLSDLTIFSTVALYFKK